MDSVAGVYFPRGGMHQLPVALAGAAAKHGVEFRYGTTVTTVEHSGGRASAVVTADGERIPADVVVLNPDLPVAYRDLLGIEPRSVRRLRYCPSCFLLLAGSTAHYNRTAHHNIHFGRAWDEVFRDLIDRGRLMTDPSLLVTNPTYTDPSLAPAGKQVYYVLFPTPNLDADIDWSEVGPRYRDEVVRTLEARGYIGFGDADRGRARHYPGGLGAAAAWNEERRSRPPTASPRPVRSDRTTSGERTWCSPARVHNPVSGFPWYWFPADWPPNGSPGRTLGTAHARCSEPPACSLLTRGRA